MASFCNAICKSGLYCRCYSKDGYDKCVRHLRNCPVCFDPIKSDAHTVALQCNHIYCDSCIKQWLSTKSTCPTCRANVPWQRIVDLTGRAIMPFPGTLSGLPSLSIQGQYLQLTNVIRSLMSEVGAPDILEPFSDAAALQATIQSLERIMHVLTPQQQQLPVQA